MISFFCSLEPILHFYCLSMAAEADSPTHQRQDTNHTHFPTDTHTHPSSLDPPWPTHRHVCLVVWSGKSGSKSENHKSQTGHHSAPAIAGEHVQAHVLLHTSQTERAARPLQKDRRNSWGTEGIQLGNYKLWGPDFSMTLSQQLLEFTSGGSAPSPGKGAWNRGDGGFWDRWMSVPPVALGFGGLSFHHAHEKV